MTAVKWLEDEIRWYISNDERLYDMFKKAKEMEKQQIIDACKQCSYSYEEAEQYYKENFKSE